MINTRFFISFLALLYLNPVLATPVSHPHFQPMRGEIELKSTATVTWLAFIDVYDAALYVGDGAQPTTLLEGPSPFSLELRYKVSLSKAQLIEGADVALGSTLSNIMPNIDLMLMLYISTIMMSLRATDLDWISPMNMV